MERKECPHCGKGFDVEGGEFEGLICPYCGAEIEA